MISKAKNAAKISQEASEKEFISMAYGKCAIEAANGDGTVTGEMIQQALQTDNENLQCSVDIVYPNNSTRPSASIHFTKSGNEFLVKLSDGTTEKVLNDNTKAITVAMMRTAAAAHVGTDTDLQGYAFDNTLFDDDVDPTEHQVVVFFENNEVYHIYLKDGTIEKAEAGSGEIGSGEIGSGEIGSGEFPFPGSGTGVN